MQTIEITQENFETEVMQSEKPVLLDFWAPWCAPCQALSPIIEEIAEEATYIKTGKVNIDEHPQLAAAFGAMSIPLLVVVNGGKIAKQQLGAVPKENVLELISEYK